MIKTLLGIVAVLGLTSNVIGGGVIVVGGGGVVAAGNGGVYVANTGGYYANPAGWPGYGGYYYNSGYYGPYAGGSPGWDGPQSGVPVYPNYDQRIRVVQRTQETQSSKKCHCKCCAGK